MLTRTPAGPTQHTLNSRALNTTLHSLSVMSFTVSVFFTVFPFSSSGNLGIFCPCSSTLAGPYHHQTQWAEKIAFGKSLSSLTQKKQPRSHVSIIIFCQTELLLDKVAPFPTIHKQCLQENKRINYIFVHRECTQ